MIQFEFDIKKATQAACHFIKKEGGRINYMKLIKLLYIADREALKKWEAPITCDRYFSLPHGPVVSEILDTINYKPKPGEDSYWHKHIVRNNYNVSAHNECEDGELSEREIELIEKVSHKFRHFNQWQIEKYCHRYLKEWQDPEGSSKPIEIEDIFRAVGKSTQVIKEIEKDIHRFNKAKQFLECH